MRREKFYVCQDLKRKKNKILFLIKLGKYENFTSINYNLVYGFYSYIAIFNKYKL
ncbi:protein of unknown function [Methanocaldococcus lauensis]|nr:protein of unknown function [Methanocaldococcus lauensis]